MNFLWFLIIGALAGWLAGQIIKGRGFGFIGNLIVGIVGGILGGFIFGILNIEAVGLIGELVAALVGAIVFLWLVSFIKKK